MIKNYIIIAFRNLLRQFSYSLINIVGLAIGLACSAVIFMYVYGEWSYDRHFPHANRTYRIGVGFFNLGGLAIAPEVLGTVLPEQYQGVEAFTRISKENSLLLATDTKQFQELAYYTDVAFFQIFPRTFISGNAATALRNDNSIVLTESVAERIFGTPDAMGKTLVVGKEKKLFSVTGIVKDDRRPSQLTSSIWLSNHGKLKNETRYTSASMYNYVLLKEGQQQKDLEAALDRILEKEVYPQRMGVPSNVSFEEYKQHPNAVQFPVYPFTDVHLKSTLRFEISPVGNEQNLYTFGAISLFVLLLASVNFINLTTARAARRAREVGIRKVVGSSRPRLVVQFLCESMLIAMIAMLLALFVGEAFLLIFQLISGSSLIPSLWTPWNLAILLLFTIAIGLFSGIYPGFYLTSFQPVRVLKGELTANGGGNFRNILVVAQFSISLCLMMCTAVIIHQMNFMKDRPLGFDQENTLTIDNIHNLGNHADAFEQYLLSLSGVTQAARHTGEPGNESSKMVYSFRTKDMPDAMTINTYITDDRVIPLMGFELVDGRNFNHELASDSSAVIFNETAVKVLGLKDPVGTRLKQGGQVIGVVKDYHWQTMREEIGPSAFVMSTTDYAVLSLRLTPSSAAQVVEKAAEKWKELVPDEAFKYHFLDENFEALLEKERIFGKAVGFFTTLAIFVSCLGLYGLSAYTTEQRNKEIGIRKVMGASASHIVMMLNKRFAMLVSISVLIATPAAALIMLKWLEGFAYRADMTVDLFVVSIALAFIVALITVSYHSIKASLTNPVDALKYE